jgi:hypothetical protein
VGRLDASGGTYPPGCPTWALAVTVKRDLRLFGEEACGAVDVRPEVAPIDRDATNVATTTTRQIRITSNDRGKRS